MAGIQEAIMERLRALIQPTTEGQSKNTFDLINRSRGIAPGVSPVQGPQRPAISTGGGGFDVGSFLNTPTPPGGSLQGGVSVGNPPVLPPVQGPQIPPGGLPPQAQIPPELLAALPLLQKSSEQQEEQEKVLLEQVEKNKEQEEKRADLIRKMVKFGLPLGAAIAASVNPNLLPAASGFVGGFADELAVGRERESKEEIATEKREIKTLETLRKEERKDKKDIRREAERAVDKTDLIFTTAEQRETAINKLASAMEERRGLSKAAVTVDKILEEADEKLSSFNSEAGAREAGHKNGDRVIINGVAGTLGK